jgi:hypothetical protein
MKMTEEDKKLIETYVEERSVEKTFHFINVNFDENMNTNWLESGDEKSEREYISSNFYCSICNQPLSKINIEYILKHLHEHNK